MSINDNPIFRDAVGLFASNPGLHQDELEALLEERWPCPPGMHPYANPAAEAIMRQLRAEYWKGIGIEADRMRLRASGKPESWADRAR